MQFFLHFTLPSPQDWLPYFLLPPLVSTPAIKTREVEVEDVAPESAGNSLFGISEHVIAVIHHMRLLTRIPGMDFGRGQKAVNHFVARFIGQCLLILLVCQIQRYIPAQNDKYISRWITYFKANQQRKLIFQAK